MCDGCGILRVRVRVQVAATRCTSGCRGGAPVSRRGLGIGGPLSAAEICCAGQFTVNNVFEVCKTPAGRPCAADRKLKVIKRLVRYSVL